MAHVDLQKKNKGTWPDHGDENPKKITSHVRIPIQRTGSW